MQMLRSSLVQVALPLVFSLSVCSFSPVAHGQDKDPKARLNPESVEGVISSGVLYPGRSITDRYRIVKNYAAGTKVVSRQDSGRIDEVIQEHSRAVLAHWKNLHDMLLGVGDITSPSPVLEMDPLDLVRGKQGKVLVDVNARTGLVWKRWELEAADGDTVERYASFNPATRERTSEVARGIRHDDTFFSDRFTRHSDGRVSWITKMSDGMGQSSVLVHHVLRNAQGTIVRDKYFREDRAGEELPIWGGEIQ